MDVRKLTDSRDWLESERVIETAFLHPWDEDQARKKIEAQASGATPRPEESWGLFSCAFYRKFGFEMAARMVRQRVGIEQLAGFSCDMRVTRIWEETDLVAARGLWDAFAATHDLVELREDEAWMWRGNGDYGAPDFLHEDRQRYTYVLWDGENPCAYVRFSFFHDPDMPFVGELQVSELVWDSPVALRAVLGFLYRMRAKVSHVNLELADVELATMVPEGDKVEQGIDSHVMARLLDPARLLRLMPQPYGEGTYALDIEDAFLPEVAGRWRVTYADGHATSVEATDSAPDLKVDETVACQLVLGRIGFDEARYRPNVQVLGNVETLSHTFVRRPVYLAL